MLSNTFKVYYLVAFYTLLSSFTLAQDNWTWLNPLPHGSDLVSADFFPGTGTAIGVGASGLVMRSTNNGTAWSHIPLSITADINSVSLIDNSTGFIAGGASTLYKTSNGGETWTLVANNLSADFNQILFLSSSTGYLLTGGSERKIYITSDGGVTWSLIVDYDAGRGEINCIYSDSDQKIYFGTFNGGVYSAVSPVWGPSLLYTLTNIKAITGNGLNLIAISDFQSVAYSSDGGASWLNGSGAALTDFSPNGGRFLSGQNAVIFSVDGRIAVSTNYGANWTEVANTSNSLQLLSVAYNTGNSAILLGEYGLQYNSTDGGASWSKTESSITSALLTTSDTFDGNPIWAAGSGGTLIVSTDGGTSWSALNSGITDTIKAIKFVSDLEGYMVAKNNIYRSSNGGASWSLTKSATSGVYLNAITASDADMIAVAGSSSAVLFTHDGGASWTSKTVGTKDHLTIFAVPGTLLLLLAGNSGKIYKSTDWGGTWPTEVTAIGTFNSMYFTSSTIGWVVGNAGKIFRTFNGGGSWFQVVHDLTTYNLRSVKFSGTDHGVIAGNFGTVLKTENAGTDWTRASKITENLLLSATLVDASTTLLTGTNGTIIKSSNAPLPVELVGFTATHKNGTVTLNWETKTEIDNYGFEIERKSSATGWQKIGFVEGHFTTNSPKYYNFTDRPNGTGKIQYRLKQIDNDGSFEYSPVVEVDLSGMLPREIEIKNFPNPFNPETNINIIIPETADATVDVYNSTGEKVATLFDGKLNSGETRAFKLDGATLPSGMYIVHVSAGKHRKSHKVLLMK